jgi:hypothetical protein
VVTGNVVPSQYGTVSITYGTNSDQHNVSLRSLAGSVSHSLPYDSQAQYYYGNAIITGPGNVTVAPTVVERVFVPRSAILTKSLPVLW